MPLAPLRFKPVLRRYLWGGRRLGTMLGKPIGPESDYAESWEVVDHGADQSVVAGGPLDGTRLCDLVAEANRELFGQHAPQAKFPLLLKFLDAQQKLSLQVHPDDTRARRLTPPDLGKTEAWVVLSAEPASFLYAGLKRGFDRAALQREVARGTSHLCVAEIKPHAGDCYFIPAGVVHGLGPGLMIAEIQQSSDTTYRLYDWNRVGVDGQPRTLHIEQALDAIDYTYGPVAAQTPRPTDRANVERLVECEQFVLDRWRLDAPDQLGGDDRFHIVAVLAGSLQVSQYPTGQPLKLGEVMLVPAAIGAVDLLPQPGTVILDIYLPATRS